jgi:LPS export ABC transporter protein LptC
MSFRNICFLLVIGLALALASCENEISKVKAFDNDENPPSLAADGFEMLVSDSAVIRFKLQTPELIRHTNVQEMFTEFPKGVIIERYSATMKVTSSITADYAKNFDADDRWEAKNNVVAVNQQGDTLKTEYLIWDNKRKKIYSDQFVKVIQKDEVFTGTGFEANPDFTEYTFKNLKGHMYVNINN